MWKDSSFLNSFPCRVYKIFALLSTQHLSDSSCDAHIFWEALPSVNHATHSLSELPLATCVWDFVVLHFWHLTNTGDFNLVFWSAFYWLINTDFTENKTVMLSKLLSFSKKFRQDCYRVNFTHTHTHTRRRGIVVSGVRQWTKLTHVGPSYNWDGWVCHLGL